MTKREKYTVQSREQILDRLRDQVSKGIPITGAGRAPGFPGNVPRRAEPT